MGKYTGKSCRLLSMLSLTSSFFLVEIVVGYITNSVALIADSFHMLSDVIALIIGFASVRIAKWHSRKNTFGWARAEVLGALVNAVFLIALCFSILVESLKRLVKIEEIEDPKLMLIVGAAGLLVNLIGLFLFSGHGHSHGGGGGHSHGGEDHEHENEHGHEHEAHHEHEILVEPSEMGEPNGNAVVIEITDKSKKKQAASAQQLNMRAVFLHVLGDALGSVIVIISALVIWFVEHDWKNYVDPAMSILLVCIILSTTIPLLKQSAFILLQTVPSHIHIGDLKSKLEQMPGIMAIHEFHVWQLAGNRIIASAHVLCRNLHEYMMLAGQVKELFHNEGIHSTTIQPEFIELEDETSIANCRLECDPSKKCQPKTCCGTKPISKNTVVQKSPKSQCIEASSTDVVEMTEVLSSV